MEQQQHAVEAYRWICLDEQWQWKWDLWSEARTFEHGTLLDDWLAMLNEEGEAKDGA